MADTSCEMSKIIFDVISNQIKENQPPVTRKTVNRLIEDGYSAYEAKLKIASVVRQNIFAVMHEKKLFDSVLYEDLLDNIGK